MIAPTAEDVEQGPAIVVYLSFISVAGVYGDLCSNLTQGLFELIHHEDRRYNVDMKEWHVHSANICTTVSS